MASTEFYIIKQDKHIDYYGAAKAAMMGSLHIWNVLEKKYLPSLERYSWEIGEPREEEYKSRVTQSMVSFFSGGQDYVQEVWNLGITKDIDVDWKDRLVMESTMDNVYIAYDDMVELADALRSVEYATDNMKTQADLFDEIHEKYTKDDIIGVFVLGTSVCSIRDQASYSDDDTEHEFPLFNEEWDDCIGRLKKLRDFGYDIDKYIEFENNNKTE